MLSFLGTEDIPIPAWKFDTRFEGPVLNGGGCRAMTEDSKSTALNKALSSMINSIVSE